MCVRTITSIPFFNHIRCHSVSLFSIVSGYVPPPPSIRLVDSSVTPEGTTQGRVELFVDGQWTAICDNGWGLPEAAVACTHLGYSRSVRSSINSGT